MKGRTSGHLRITKTRTRRGDNTQMARVSFVDDLKEAPVAKKADSPKPVADSKPTAKKAASSKLPAKSSKKETK
jgi:hypothetical protein